MKKKLIYFWRYWFWNLCRQFVFFYLRQKFNLVIDKNAPPIPKPPFIMVSNHGTFFDPWLVGHFSRYPLSIMMNEDGFKASPFIRWYQEQIGCFPKKKGASDYRAMKITLKMLRQGYGALIFPEGQTTWDGETQPIYPGIEKIAKKAQAGLVIMHLKGNFLSKPWWAGTFRKGRVLVTWKVVDPATVQSTSETELRDMMISFIYQNDIKDEQNRSVTFSGSNLATGLEHFMWICRQCKKDDTLATNENTVSCTACNSSWTMDAYCRFTPRKPAATEIGDLYDWSSWHKKMVKDKIRTTQNDVPITQSKNVLYGKTVPDGTFVVLAEGTLSLTKQALSFICKTGSDLSFHLPVSEINDYVFQRKDIFECYCQEKTYRFRFLDHSPMKWVFYLRYLNDYEECEKRGYL